MLCSIENSLLRVIAEIKENLTCCDILDALCGRGKVINYFETSSFLKIVMFWILLIYL